MKIFLNDFYFEISIFDVYMSQIFIENLYITLLEPILKELWRFLKKVPQIAAQPGN